MTSPEAVLQVLISALAVHWAAAWQHPGAADTFFRHCVVGCSILPKVMAEALFSRGRRAWPDLNAAVRGVGLRPVFQPIVDLADGLHRGYEALARWPELAVSPADVFAYATRTAQSDRLDQLCITAALETGLAAGPPRGTILALNCEPASTYIGPDRDPLLAHGIHAFSPTFELTERCLLNHPRLCWPRSTP